MSSEVLYCFRPSFLRSLATSRTVLLQESRSCACLINSSVFSPVRVITLFFHVLVLTRYVDFIFNREPEGVCQRLWHMWQHVGIFAKNRSAWRAGITSGAHSAEARRLDKAEKKRAARKARAGSTSTFGSEHTCPTCGKD